MERERERDSDRDGLVKQKPWKPDEKHILQIRDLKIKPKKSPKSRKYA